MKLNRQYRPPNLWQWVKMNLPASMETHEISWGYGTCCNIYRRGEAPGAIKRHFGADGYPIATVHSDAELRLNYPEYFSDFEDMLRRYEAHTGIEPTLTYWQSPKDEPPNAAQQVPVSARTGAVQGASSTTSTSFGPGNAVYPADAALPPQGESK